jgi:hypothetical protein
MWGVIVHHGHTLPTRKPGVHFSCRITAAILSQARSTAIAMPMPPPMQRLAMPRFNP